MRLIGRLVPANSRGLCERSAGAPRRLVAGRSQLASPADALELLAEASFYGLTGLVKALTERRPGAEDLPDYVVAKSVSVDGGYEDKHLQQIEVRWA